MTVFLIRHASAGFRRSNEPTDLDRALDQSGRERANALAEQLADEAITWIESSPARRCAETVQPLAERLGLPITTLAELCEGSAVDQAWAALSAAADRPGDTVLCSHGDVIPDLIRRAQLRGMTIPGKSGNAKGSIWRLVGWDGERFERGDYFASGT